MTNATISQKTTTSSTGKRMAFSSFMNGQLATEQCAVELGNRSITTSQRAEANCLARKMKSQES